MGTRADFYIAREDGLEWLGSIAWDGYPEGVDEPVLSARTADDFGSAVSSFFADRDDATLPAEGWPWPWNDSTTTDFSYVLIEGEGVVFSSFGRQPYWTTRKGDDGDYLPARITLAFPDMSDRKSVAFGVRSGTIAVAF